MKLKFLFLLLSINMHCKYQHIAIGVLAWRDFTFVLLTFRKIASFPLHCITCKSDRMHFLYVCYLACFIFVQLTLRIREMFYIYKDVFDIMILAKIKPVVTLAIVQKRNFAYDIFRYNSTVSSDTWSINSELYIALKSTKRNHTYRCV